MKKQFTLLAGILLAGGSVFAQAPTTAKTRLKNIALDTQKHPAGNTSSEKFEGEVLWESDFSDLTDWTITTAGQGTWVIGTPTSQPDLGVGTGNPTNGLQTGYGYGTTGQNFTPPTKSNGYAGFNGIKFLLSPPVQTQNASLTSEAINFTGRNVVTVSFYQWYRAFNSDDVYLEYSADNGATWSASFPLNGNVATNTYTTGNYSVDINTGGAAQGKIRFRWESLTANNNYGSGYGWAIDDVEITDGAAAKANILFTFHSVNTENIEFSKFPANQVTGNEIVTFWSHIQNGGNDPVTATLNVTTTGYNETSAPSTSTSLQKDTLEILTADGYAIPATPGNYNFTFKVGATVDLSNSSDTVRTVPFEVTNNVMAVDSYDGTPGSITGAFGNWSEQVTGDFTGIGNFFPTFKNGVIGGVQVGFDQVSAADSTLFVGLPFSVTLLKADAEGAFGSVYVGQGEMQGSYFGSLATVYFDEAIPCAPGDQWAVIIGSQVTESGGVPVGFSGTNIKGNTLGSTSINSNVDVSLASDPLTPDRVDAPVVRLMFGSWVSLNENTLSAADLMVAPNPFSNETAISFNLDAAASVSAVVTDLSGRTVMTIPASTMNAGKQTLNIDGTSFNAGVYNVSVTINGNTATKRIVKK